MDISTLGEDLLKVVLKEVILRFKKHYTSEVDNGLDEAFQLALADWSKHAPTTSDKVRLSKALEEYIQSSTSYEALDADTRAFIDCFKKRLSEQTPAHNYLMTLRADMQAKGQEQILLEQYKTQDLIQGLIAQMGGLNMTPQDIRALLKELPLEQGLEHTESALEDMLANGRIHSEDAKRLVLEFARFLFEHTDKITEEVKRLREAGDSYLAETLEDIKRVLTGESGQSLTDVHKKYQEQVRQDEIRILKELIEAAQIQFSFGEAREFYDRLIELSPTSEHHFNYARLLYSLNDFRIARKHYEKALHAFRELSKQSPEIYKPNVVITLNNLGALLCNVGELKQARAYYEEALQICQALVGQSPELYRPNVAMTLNNLGVLLEDTNELKQAQACYEEALQVWRELAKHTPEVYNSDVAVSLNNLGHLLRVTKDFQQAQACYEEALQVWRGLAKQAPEIYNPDVAGILNNLGSLLYDINAFQQAQAYCEEALQIHRELVEQNPEAYKPDIAMTLNNLGTLLFNTNELQQAQACYEEALLILRELVKENPGIYKPTVAMTLNNLGNLLYNTNELKRAQACYEETLLILRELMKTNPEAYKLKVAMTLNNLAILYLYLEENEEADKVYQEAHDICQELANHHPRTYEIDYARILVIGFGSLGKPKEYLEEAKEILAKYPGHPQAQELLNHIEELANG
ncbi:MAG: tetratricopeptide repeat protein [Porphyromonas sp.]